MSIFHIFHAFHLTTVRSEASGYRFPWLKVTTKYTACWETKQSLYRRAVTDLLVKSQREVYCALKRMNNERNVASDTSEAPVES